MNLSCLRPSLLSLLLLGAAIPVHAQTFYGIIKQQRFVQSSSAEPRLAATEAARFLALLPAGTTGTLRDSAGVVTPLVASPAFERRFSTLAELDAAWPAGNYIMTVGGSSEVPLAMPANPYPSTVPQVTGGTWSPAGELEVDPSRDYTLTFNIFSDYGTVGVLGSIRVSILSPTGATVLERQVFSVDTPAPFSSLPIPAGTLVAGRRYSVEIQFLTVDSLNPFAVPPAYGVVGGIKETQLFLQVAVPIPPAAPTISSQPASQTMGAGNTVVFSVEAGGTPAPTYQWRRGTSSLPGETRSTLVLRGSAAVAGSYSCVVRNDSGTVTSREAALTVSPVAVTSLGRLANLSVLAPTGPGTRLLTMGATVGGQNTQGALPLVVRGIGPALSAFNLAGVLADPVLSIFPAGSTTATATNDNWGGGPALATAFEQVAAFALPRTSLDSAALHNQSAGGFTVQVAGKGTAAGTILAEVYDAAGGARSATTPRLTNLSTLTSIARSATLSAGFVIGGNTARTVLVRAVGPTLGTSFGLTGVMADPMLVLFSNDRGVPIAENDNWSAAPWLAEAGAAVGAFPLGGPATRDAALLITLAPGAYSARVSGVGTSSGTAIIEVYEVP